jgi:phosphohistidine phosphatase SixA
MRNDAPIVDRLIAALVAVVPVSLAVVSAVLASAPAGAQELTGSALVAALKKGGYVIVLRHASSPREAPDERTANPDNTGRERQLDEAGRAAAAAIGNALRDLAIPVGSVLTSPTYRALETVRFARWPNPQTVAELGDRGQSMQGVTEADGAWLRNRVAQFPSGSNTILVTHLPNITRAFPQQAAGVDDGDALVLGPGGNGAILVARIEVAEWSSLR